MGCRELQYYFSDGVSSDYHRASGTIPNRFVFRFSSEYHDSETGLVYYNYRYYSPELGRWLSRDPIGENGGWNLYNYVKNSPQLYYDIFGLKNESHCPKTQVYLIGGALEEYTGCAGSQIQTNEYFYNYQIDEIVEIISKLKKCCPDTKIAIIGHSWGGSTAVSVAEELADIHIDYLVTLDPVSLLEHTLSPNLDNVTNWINVYQEQTIADTFVDAVPVLASALIFIPATIIDVSDGDNTIGDGVATAGNQWGPESGATINISSSHGHAEVDDLLNTPQSGEAGSALQILTDNGFFDDTNYPCKLKK